MVCKEEVFTWFKELSGAKRIELLCGLMQMCIPLEIRFFGSIIQEQSKRDYNALREAEIKANSLSEFEMISACNLLAFRNDVNNEMVNINIMEKTGQQVGQQQPGMTQTNVIAGQQQQQQQQQQQSHQMNASVVNNMSLPMMSVIGHPMPVTLKNEPNNGNNKSNVITSSKSSTTSTLTMTNTSVTPLTSTHANTMQDNLNNASSVVQNTHSMNGAIMPMPMMSAMNVASNEVMASHVMAHVNPTPTLTPNAIVNASNVTINPIPQQVPGPSQSQHSLAAFPSRSKLIISLCLLNPNNRACSSIAYKALRSQLLPENIFNVISQRYFHTRNPPTDDFYSEILLLLTMAVYHPAFSFEEKFSLQNQKIQVEHIIEYLNSHYKQAEHINAHLQQFPYVMHHHNQYAHNYSPRMNTINTNVAQHQTPQYTSNTSLTPTAHSSSPPQAHTHLHLHSQPPQPQPPLPNISTLHVSNMTPVSSPSPTVTSPATKASAPVSGISPVSVSNELSSQHQLHSDPIALTSAPTGNQYLLNTSTLAPLNATTNASTLGQSNNPSMSNESVSNDVGCAKNIVTCYNCGSSGHRGDECKFHPQDEATR